jgi:2-methylcitrate dehydratase MmgE/PrpD-like protein
LYQGRSDLRGGALAAQEPAAVVTVVTTDGRRLEKRLQCSKGHPKNPFSNDDLTAKFMDSVGPLLGSSETDRGSVVEHRTRRRCVVAGEAQCENGVKAVSDALRDPLMCDALSERVKETSRFDPVSVSSTVVAYSCDLSAGLRSIP